MDDLFQLIQQIISIVVRSAVVYAIMGVYVLIRNSIFGDTNDASIVESLLVLAGAIILEEFIRNTIFGKNK